VRVLGELEIAGRVRCLAVVEGAVLAAVEDENGPSIVRVDVRRSPGPR
jgi:hypothetical protein